LGACDVSLVDVKKDERDEFLKVAELHFRGLNPSFTPQDDWKRCYFESLVGNAKFFLRWILCEGKRAGFILYGLEPHRFLPRTTGNIFELYVDPDKRRLGVGRKAAEIAIRELQRHGPSKIQLEVDEGNPGAVALWVALGFEKVTARFVLRPKI